MTDEGRRRSLVSTWHGTYLVEDGRIRRSIPIPSTESELRERIRIRRRGDVTAEEKELAHEESAGTLASRDRRLELIGVRFDPHSREEVPSPDDPKIRERYRQAFLDSAAESLSAAWDPSIHVESAVRAIADLDELVNLIGERLESWPTDSTTPALVPPDPELANARASLDDLSRNVRKVRRSLEETLEAVVPRRAPNLSRLLGASLAARLIEKAGGLARLSRLPSSTIQVLGAEKAFFAHLRGRAPPPRHGLLFLHSDLKTATRAERGRLARALAGKVAIAARLDQGGAALEPSLVEEFKARASRIRAESSKGRRRDRSALPLHGTAEDR